VKYLPQYHSVALLNVVSIGYYFESSIIIH
jgi:hypothetical protein